MQNVGAIVEGILKIAFLYIMEQKIQLAQDIKENYIVTSYLKLRMK